MSVIGAYDILLLLVFPILKGNRFKIFESFLSETEIDVMNRTSLCVSAALLRIGALLTDWPRFSNILVQLHPTKTQIFHIQ